MLQLRLLPVLEAQFLQKKMVGYLSSYYLDWFWIKINTYLEQLYKLESEGKENTFKSKHFIFWEVEKPHSTLWDLVILSVRKDPKLGEVDRNTPYILVYRTPMGNI